MRVADVLSMDVLNRASVVAGSAGLQRRVSWVHIVDLPEPGPWISRDQLLLTTGFAWSGACDDLRNLIRDLDSRGAAGLGLAVPSFHNEFPPAAKQEADRLGLPLIEVPWEIPFAEITARVHRTLLGQQQRHREQAEAVHRALTRAAIEAGSLEEIISVFSRLIQRSVSLEDVEGRVIAAHGTQFASDDVRHHTVMHGVTPPEILAYLNDKGYWSQIQRSRNSLRIPANPALGFGARVVCPVWLKNELEGILWVLEGDDPLGDLELQAAEHAATIVALHIARDRAVVNVEQRLGFSLIDSLLEGQFSSDMQSLERAALLGFNPQAEYRVSLFVLDEPVPLARAGYLRRERLINRLSRRLVDQGKAPLISVSLNEVSMLSDIDVDVRRMWSGMAEEGVSVCLGRIYPGVSGVRQSYLEARSVIPWAKPNAVTTYEELLLPRLLSGDLKAREDFIQHMLLPLREVLHADTYVETLRCLSSHGFHQGLAAKQLSIHPKTMQYRVNRLQHFLGKDFAEADVRFEMQVLCYLLDLVDNEEKF